jgi:site-specific recombinase XerC
MRKNRKSKVTPSQQNRRKAKPVRLPSGHYHPHAIAHAIRVACEKAFPLPPALAKRKDESRKKWWARLTDAQRAEVRTWQKSHHWHPYQLRHAYATLVRKEHGPEAVQVLLGHSRADVTQVYAERNEQLAATAAAKIG